MLCHCTDSGTLLRPRILGARTYWLPEPGLDTTFLLLGEGEITSTEGVLDRRCLVSLRPLSLLGTSLGSDLPLAGEGERRGDPDGVLGPLRGGGEGEGVLDRRRLVSLRPLTSLGASLGPDLPLAGEGELGGDPDGVLGPLRAGGE